MNQTLTGACLCGAISYQVASRPLYAAYCHCSQCRKFSGSASAPIAGFRAADVAITAGAELLATYPKTATTHLRFCKVCGSSLFAEKVLAGVVHLRLGTADIAPEIRPAAHIHVASKAPWHEIPNDGLPRFDGAPPQQRVQDYIAAETRPEVVV